MNRKRIARTLLSVAARNDDEIRKTDKLIKSMLDYRGRLIWARGTAMTQLKMYDVESYELYKSFNICKIREMFEYATKTRTC